MPPTFPRALSAAALVLAGALAGAHPLWAQTGARTGAVAGRVVDAQTGEPAAEVRVAALSTEGDTAASALSDAAGRYRLSPVPAGTYTLVARRTGYEARRLAGVRVAAGETTTPEPLRLRPRARALDPVVVAASRRAEPSLDAPARVAVIDAREIAEWPALSVVDHLGSLAAVDVIRRGIDARDASVRGFNDLRSGALNVLVDGRIARLPGLRADAYPLIPITDADLARIEALLGPGSALYGPNAADGVLRLVTRSPLDSPGTDATVGGGERGLFHAGFRTAHRVRDGVGVKLSGRYLRGRDWEYDDPEEARARERALPADPDTRIGRRDFDIERWAVDARADWRLTANATAVLSAGLASATGVEPHGLGAAQLVDWRSGYYQARLSRGPLFAQAYLNFTDSGDDGYQLRTGDTVREASRMFVAQLRHGFGLGERQRFTYGADLFRTMPDTKGTLHGANEADDDVTVIGAYLQSETSLHPKLDLLLAGRFDDHSAVDDPILSPRAALVYSAAADHRVRAVYDRSFRTPYARSFFHDLALGRAPDELGRLGYRMRLQGNDGGFTFRRPNGTHAMRSPFTPEVLGGPGALLPVNGALMYHMAIGVLQAEGRLSQEEAELLAELNPEAGRLGVIARDAHTDDRSPLGAGSGDPYRVAPLDVSTRESYELGYSALIGERLRVTADLWYARVADLLSPPRIRSPLLTLNPNDLTQFLRSRGLPPLRAEALAKGLAEVPVAVLSSDAVNATGADLLVTYVNYGTVELWGTDVSLELLLNDRWSLGAGASRVSDDAFRNERAPGERVPLNAPATRLALRIGYRDEAAGVTGGLRARYRSGFPARTGVHRADRCLDPDSQASAPCIDAATVLDLSFGYRLPWLPRATLRLSVTNLLDDTTRGFPGTPRVGRLASMRLDYRF